LHFDPGILAALKPAPIPTPLTVPILIRAFAISASILSNTGSPMKRGQVYV